MMPPRVPRSTPRSPRHKTFAPTRLRDGEIEMRVHLLNLSTTGALAHAERPPRSHSMVQLWLAGEMIEAQTVWLDGSRFGIVFTQPLKQLTIDRVIAGD